MAFINQLFPLWWSDAEMSSQQQCAASPHSMVTHTHTRAHTNPLTSHYLQQNKSQTSLSGVLITPPAAVHLWLHAYFFLCEISFSAVLAHRDWDWSDLMQATQLTRKKKPNIMGIMAGRYVQAVITAIILIRITAFDSSPQQHSPCCACAWWKYSTLLYLVGH